MEPSLYHAAPNQDKPNPLVEFVRRLQAEKARLATLDWSLPAPPPEPPLPNHYKLRWRPGQLNQENGISLPEARDILYDRMWTYTNQKRPGRLLLIKGQPGLGKTHAAVKVAQHAAEQGLRVLYAMPTHEHFATLQAFQHFQPALWYHWQSFTAVSTETQNTMCLYPQQMAQWNEKGYPAMKLCDSLCAFYKANCEYRRQKHRQERIIAGVHQHIATGLSISDFDVVIVDELPIAAFLRPRAIPKDGLPVSGIGPVVDLINTIREEVDTLTGKQHLQGLALMKKIAEYLPDVYTQLEEFSHQLPAVPWINNPGEVQDAAWFYVEDLLMLLLQEFEAYQRGLTHWLERVILTSGGLILLKRADPWGELPVRTIVLDATGEGDVYQQLFHRKVETIAPHVARLGRIFQIAHRLNGKDQIVENWETSGQEALALTQALVHKHGYQKPGVVTFKKAAKEFAKVYGGENVLHFYNQRGSNQLEKCDAVFVVGGPQLTDISIMNQVKILFSTRIAPFQGTETHGGHFKPVRHEKEIPYEFLNAAGEQPTRVITGFWEDVDLLTIARVYREQELHQAIHRGRLLTNPCDVWLLTSIPTPERLDQLHDTPHEALGIAEDWNWPAWAKLLAWLTSLQEEITLSYTADERLGTLGLDTITGLAKRTLMAQHWLERIQNEFPKLTRLESLKVGGQRGRPTAGVFIARTPLN